MTSSWYFIRQLLQRILVITLREGLKRSDSNTTRGLKLKEDQKVSTERKIMTNFLSSSTQVLKFEQFKNIH